MMDKPSSTRGNSLIPCCQMKEAVRRKSEKLHQYLFSLPYAETCGGSEGQYGGPGERYEKFFGDASETLGKR